MERVEKLKNKMKEGKLVKGFFLTMSDCIVAEMAGYAGYDYVWIDAEHAPLDRQEILRHIIAAQGAGCAAFVRVPGVDRKTVKAILDMGPDGIIFPFTNSKEIAEEEIRACEYPDRGGVRGQGPIRAIRYGFEDENSYIAHAQDRILKIGQIETVEAYENLDEILNVKGFDSFFIGCADMARSIAGSKKGYNVDKIFAEVCRKVREKGFLMGTAIGAEAKAAEYARDHGIQWVVFGQDARALACALKDNLEKLKDF